MGHVRGGRVDATDDDWGGVEATIELDNERFSSDVVAGLDDFSHVEVVYVFDQVDEAGINLGAPRTPTRQPGWATALMAEYWVR